MDEPAPVPTERVAAAISSPLLHERDVDVDVDLDVPVVAVGSSPVPDIPAPAAELPPVLAEHPTWVVTAAVGIGATVATGDPRVGLALAGIVGVAGLIRSADRRVPFSFGEGFVGYRADLGWPRGVQEEDDVTWSVRPVRSPSPRTAALPKAGPISGR